jgi:Family of unknown function (DUF5320)
MPGGDRTGPNGAGPMTGRVAGYCAGYAVSGYANPVCGYGSRGGRRGYGRGWGRGFGRGWYGNVPVTVVPPVFQQAYVPVVQQTIPEQEIANLEDYQKNLTAEKAGLEQELDGVNARIEELKAKQARK